MTAPARDALDRPPSLADAFARDGGAVARTLAVDPACGLSEDQVVRRRAQFGDNTVPTEPPRSLVRSVLAELRETVILVLLAAAVLTAVTGDLTDCAVILLVVAVNTTVGVVQERRAVGAVRALTTLAAPTCTVRRAGGPHRTAVAGLVPGDVVLVAEGDVVGADARVLEAHELQVDEALLTGESDPSDRRAHPPCPQDAPVAERMTMLHAGTLVVHGTGRAVVVATGAASQLGRIAGMLHEHAAPPTPLQRRLAALGQRLSLLVIFCCGLVVIMGLLLGRPWELTVVTGISLAVAAIPESLPAVVALALAGGTRRMARRGAIVRSLPAVEALGSVTVLATDKTGTLTAGSTAVVATWTPTGGTCSLADPAAHDLLVAGVLCNDATGRCGGTDGALLAAADAAGIDIEAERRSAPRTAETPFDSQRRSMRTRHRVDGGEREILKGAPEVVFAELRTADPSGKVVADWTGEAYRVLAIAAGPPDGLGLLGLVALADPVRPEARAAVLAARAAGIRPVMITGDHPSTAAAVAARTGVTDAAEPPTAPDAPLRPVYAGIDPTEKLGIIAAWRRAGHVVAMTGDGVNDAPALRAADVGVAMGVRGTEVAKQAADVVLTDDSLSTIVAAVAEGRRVFDNVRRFVRYGVAGGLAELLVMLMGPFLGLALPLLPAQILWINLLTHGLPGVAFGAEQAEPDVLSRPPRPPTDGVLSKRGWWEVLTLAVAIATSCLLLACWLAALHRPWQTPLFGALAIGQLGVALTTRSALRPVWRTPPSGNPFLYVAVAGSLLAVAAAIWFPPLAALLRTVPPTGADIGWMLVAGTVPAVVVELMKARRRRAARTGQSLAGPLIIVDDGTPNDRERDVPDD